MKKRLHPWLRTMRKYFIPHRHNRYHPHVLHTKHVVGFGVLFTALKGMLVVVALFVPAQAFLVPDVLAEQGDKILALTNQVRADNGLPALTEVVVLDRAAQAKAEDMNANQYFSHVSPNGHGLNYFLSSKGYKYVTAGENLAVGFSDADSVVKAWMKSPTHFANLVDKDFQQVGVGIMGGVYQGKPTVFVAQHLGLPLPKDTQNAPKKEPELRLPTPQPSESSTTTRAIAAVTPSVPPKPSTAEQAPKTDTKPAQQVAVVVPAPAKPVVRPVATKTPPKPVETPTQVAQVPVAPPHAAPVQAIPAPSVAPAPSTYEYNTSVSFVGWSDVQNQTRLDVQASLKGSIVSAMAVVEGYHIPLQQDADGLYRGSLTVPESSDDLFDVIIAPTVFLTLQDGRTASEIIDWSNPKIVSQTPWQRYMQVNSWLGGSIPVYVIVRYVYWAALLFFAVALGLNIFIEFRRQHPHVIVQTLGLIALLFLFIKF